MTQTLAVPVISPNPPVTGQPAKLTLVSSATRNTELVNFEWDLKDGSSTSLQVNQLDPGTLKETGDASPHVWSVVSDDGITRVLQTPSW